jgi:hypothetical protein
LLYLISKFIKLFITLFSMAIPKFTGNVTLENPYVTKGTFHSPMQREPLNFTSKNMDKVVPFAPYWGDFRREGCVSGKRKYSSILWGATGSWEQQCRETPAYITNAEGVRGTYYASRCDNQGFNMWGIFYVPESSCGTPTTRRCYCNEDGSLSKQECARECYSWCCQEGDLVTCQTPLCSPQ